MVHMDSEEQEIESQCEFAPKATHEFNHHSNIILYPFAHQVGGHTQLLTLDKSTLCKPLIPQELLFYLNVPKELVDFVPSYKGVVQIRETATGTYPPVVYQPLRSPKSPYAKYGPGSSCTLPAKVETSRSQESKSKDRRLVTSADLANSRSPLEVKVQIKQCSDEKILRRNLSRDNLLKANYISRPNEKYLLLLENVASKYQLPCILDLKMGIRQHGDDATEEKRHRQIAKCQASTSASLGVRLCGMQVYQVDYGAFLWYDKYYGRKMDEEGLKGALHQYFHNGYRLNEDIIDDVIERLKLLSDAIEKSPSFRFYGTSLLIIHEGCTSRSMRKCPVEVRLIDFAHTICDYSSSTTTPTTNTANATPINDSPMTNANKRSNSSPSVLRSSSAEQLSNSSSLISTDDDETIPNDCLPSVTPHLGNKITSDGKQRATLLNDYNNNNETTNQSDTSSNSNIDQSDEEIHDKFTPKGVFDPDKDSLISKCESETSRLTIPGQKQTPDIAKQVSNQSSQGINRKPSKSPLGPDNGLLFGLENLMRLLDDLKSQYHVESEEEDEDDEEQPEQENPQSPSHKQQQPQQRQPMMYSSSIVIPNGVPMQL